MNSAFYVSALEDQTDGEFIVTVEGTDPLGHARSLSRSFVLDRTPPTPDMESGEEWTSDTPFAWVGTVLDTSAVEGAPNSGVTSIVVQHDTDVPVSEIIPSWDPETGAVEALVDLQEGSNSLTLVALDGVGNTEQAFRTIQLDTTPPVLSLDVPQEDAWSASPILTATGSVSDSGVGLDTLVLAVGGGDDSAITVNVSDEEFSTALPPADVAVGDTFTVQATATDLLGNAVTVERVVGYDPIQPEPPAVVTAGEESVLQIFRPEFALLVVPPGSNLATFEFQATDTGGSGIALLRAVPAGHDVTSEAAVDGLPEGSATPIGQGVSLALPVSPANASNLPESWEVHARDHAGNWSPSSTAVHVMVDTLAPLVVLQSGDPEAWIGQGSLGMPIPYAVTDSAGEGGWPGSGIVGIQMRLCPLPEGSVDWVCTAAESLELLDVPDGNTPPHELSNTFSVGIPPSEGTYLVQLFVTDLHGNGGLEVPAASIPVHRDETPPLVKFVTSSMVQQAPGYYDLSKTPSDEFPEPSAEWAESETVKIHESSGLDIPPSGYSHDCGTLKMFPFLMTPPNEDLASYQEGAHVKLELTDNSQDVSENGGFTATAHFLFTPEDAAHPEANTSGHPMIHNGLSDWLIPIRGKQFWNTITEPDDDSPLPIGVKLDVVDPAGNAWTGEVLFDIEVTSPKLHNLPVPVTDIEFADGTPMSIESMNVHEAFGMDGEPLVVARFWARNHFPIARTLDLAGFSSTNQSFATLKATGRRTYLGKGEANAFQTFVAESFCSTSSQIQDKSAGCFHVTEGTMSTAPPPNSGCNQEAGTSYPVQAEETASPSDILSNFSKELTPPVWKNLTTGEVFTTTSTGSVVLEPETSYEIIFLGDFGWQECLVAPPATLSKLGATTTDYFFTGEGECSSDEPGLLATMDDHAICYIPEKQFGFEIIPDQAFIRSFVPVLESMELHVSLLLPFHSALQGANQEKTIEQGGSFFFYTSSQAPPTIVHPAFPGENLPL